MQLNRDPSSEMTASSSFLHFPPFTRSQSSQEEQSRVPNATSWPLETTTTSPETFATTTTVTVETDLEPRGPLKAFRPPPLRPRRAIRHSWRAAIPSTRTAQSSPDLEKPDRETDLCASELLLRP